MLEKTDSIVVFPIAFQSNLKFLVDSLRQFSEEEHSLTAQAGVLGRTLLELKRLDPDAVCLLSLHEQAFSFLRDLQSDLSHYADKLDTDPARLQLLEDRLNLIQSLKRKYGASAADVIEFGEQARQKLQDLEQRDAHRERLQAELRKTDAELTRVGGELSAQRRRVVPKLSQAVARELRTRARQNPRRQPTPESQSSIRQSRPPVSTRSNSNSPPTPANRPARSAPLLRPAKWRVSCWR